MIELVDPPKSHLLPVCNACCGMSGVKQLNMSKVKAMYLCGECQDGLRAALCNESKTYYETLRSKDKWIRELLDENAELAKKVPEEDLL